MRGPRGVALIQALVIVTALAAIAAALLARADTARQRLAWLRQADQADLYLDGLTALALMLMEQDHRDGPLDHPGEFWAERTHDVPIDYGSASGQISDAQSRFNVNWLAGAGDAAGARAAFERLAGAQGLSPGLAARLADALTPAPATDPGRRARAMADGPLASLPFDAPLQSVDELRLVAGMTDADFDRLAPFLAALPADSRLNVNTVAPEVLAAFLPLASDQAVGGLLAARAVRPFTSAGDFLAQARRILTEQAMAQIPAARLAVGSSWFEARMVARLDSAQVRRKVLLRRNAEDGITAIALTQPEQD